MSFEPLFVTGMKPDRSPLFGGVWTLWHRDGFPLALSPLMLCNADAAADWAEAMCDASLSDNLPALMRALESFLSADEIAALKAGFTKLLATGKSFAEIIAEKRRNGEKLREAMKVISDQAAAAAL